jgi:hypothetical protein
MTSADDAAVVFQPLPGRTVDRSAAYEALLRDLLGMVGAEAPDEADPRGWQHLARRAVGKVLVKTAAAPDEWFEPVMRAAVHEPDPSFVRDLVWPAVAAFGRGRVQLALIAYLRTGTAADIAGAARASYCAQVPLSYLPGSSTPTPESVAEYEAFDDLREQYRHTALRRFVEEDDLDVRRCILPGLPLDLESYPAEVHDLVTEAIRIARESDDDYLRHRVELQVRPDA